MGKLRNKTDQELSTEKEALESKRDRLERIVEREGRELNYVETSLISDINELIDEYKHEIKMRGPANSPLSMPGPRNPRPSRACGLFNSWGEQLQAVHRAGLPGGQVDQRLYHVSNAASGLGESVPSDGGFLVQPELSSEILQDAFEVGQLARRCRRQPIGANANGIKIPGVDETSRADGSRFGGVRSYWLDEAAEKQASKPKFRQIELNLKKNVVLVYVTDELLADATALEAFVREACPAEIAFSVDDSIINGTGAGQPLGILNSGCLVTVSKETGQAADTVVAENILNMYKRTLGASVNYAWLHSKSITNQVYGLSLAVGTGGVPMFMAAGSLPNQPENRLLGLPLIEVEQCAALGDLGDIVLADLKNGYILADKGNVQADVSIHVRFVWDESVFRFVYRVDGQPVRASALTPYKGGASNTQSHFIALAERA